MTVRLIKRAKTKAGWQQPGFEITHPDEDLLVALKTAEKVPEQAPPPPPTSRSTARSTSTSPTDH